MLVWYAFRFGIGRILAIADAVMIAPHCVVDEVADGVY